MLFEAMTVWLILHADPGRSTQMRLKLVAKIGAPGEIRTPGLLVRSQTLYPTELRARRGNLKVSIAQLREKAKR